MMGNNQGSVPPPNNNNHHNVPPPPPPPPPSNTNIHHTLPPPSLSHPPLLPPGIIPPPPPPPSFVEETDIGENEQFEVFPAVVGVHSTKGSLKPLSFKKLIENAHSSHHLSLASYTLKISWDQVYNIPGLMSLDLRDCGLRSVPPGIMTIQSLVELDLSHNPLVYLPVNIGGLKNLQRLRFSAIWIKRLPVSMKNLNHLVELTIDSFYQDWGWVFPPYDVCASSSARELVQWMKVHCKYGRITDAPKDLSLGNDCESTVYTWGSNLRRGEPHNLLPVLLKVSQLTQEIIFQVACGESHVVFLTDAGRVLTCGRGDFGVLGNSGGRDKDTPTIVEDLASIKIIDVACGITFSVALSETGDVYTWGKIGKVSIAHHAPVLEEHLRRLKITKISCGLQHILALSNFKTVYSWGLDSFGRLGRPGSMLVPTPVRFPEGSNDASFVLRPLLTLRLLDEQIVYIACGDQHSLCIDVKGRIWGWGRNVEAQLGLLSDSISSLVEGRNIIAAPILIPNLEGHYFTKVCAGSRHSVALSKGVIWTWGDTRVTHEIGLDHKSVTFPSVVSEIGSELILDIASGSHHSVALSETGKVWCWGKSWLGQLGQGHGQGSSVPKKVENIKQTIYKIAAGGTMSLAIAGLLRSELGEQIGIAFNNAEYFPDVEFLILCASNSSKKISILAHRCILAARSPFLKNILDNSKEYTQTVVTDKDLTAYMRRYLYKDRVDTGLINNTLRELAIQFQVERLAAICDKLSVAIPKSTIASDFISLVNNGLDGYPGDVRILVENSAVCAHRVFLCTRSGYFRAMLKGGMSESRTGVISLADDNITTDTIETALMYIYSGRLLSCHGRKANVIESNTGSNPGFDVDDIDVNIALELIPLSNLIQMDTLKQLCESVVQKGITSESILYVWQMSKYYEAAHLKAVCVEIMFKDNISIKNLDYWMSLSEEDKNEILHNLELFSKAIKK